MQGAKFGIQRHWMKQAIIGVNVDRNRGTWASWEQIEYKQQLCCCCSISRKEHRTFATIVLAGPLDIQEKAIRTYTLCRRIARQNFSKLDLTLHQRSKHTVGQLNHVRAAMKIAHGVLEGHRKSQVILVAIITIYIRYPPYCCGRIECIDIPLWSTNSARMACFQVIVRTQSQPLRGNQVWLSILIGTFCPLSCSTVSTAEGDRKRGSSFL